MHDKTNIYTYVLSCKERLYSGLKSSYSMIELFLRYSVSSCEKTAGDILFTFDKLGILMQFSCNHIPYVSNNV